MITGQVQVPPTCWGGPPTGGQYFVKPFNYQYQLPAGSYVVAGDLVPTMAQFAARYFQAC